MPGESFWNGFEKKALVLANLESQDSKKDFEDEPPSVLGRSISKSGPVLSDLTLESDRGKFETFKG